jgi:hypothetical protein
MENNSDSNSLVSVLLVIISILIVLLGIYCVVNMFSGMGYALNFIDNIHNYNSNFSENDILVSKITIWVSGFYVVVFMFSLATIPLIISFVLEDSMVPFGTNALKLSGKILIFFGLVVFVSYMTYSDKLNEIEWIRNFRLWIGFSFLVVNLIHGIICIGIAGLGDVRDELESKNNKLNTSNSELAKAEAIITALKAEKRKQIIPITPTNIFCSNCGTSNAASDKFCNNCGFKL